MPGTAKSVDAYVNELPSDRREAIRAVRAVIRENLDPGYQESISGGMIAYSVPHSRYPLGYHCDPKSPLPLACIASQKNYMVVHLFSLYCNPQLEETWFRQAWQKSGKKLDMGKACVRFKRLDDLALDVVGEAIRRAPVDAFIDHYEQALEKWQPKVAAKRAAMSARRSDPDTAPKSAGARAKPTIAKPSKGRKPASASVKRASRGGESSAGPAKTARATKRASTPSRKKSASGRRGR